MVTKPTVTNCTFSSNSADYGGGMSNRQEYNIGIDSYSSSPTVTNCTFSSNSADYDGGGGMYNDCFPPTVWPTVTNCILWGDIGGEIYNSESSAPKVTYCDVQGGYTGTGNIAVDPQFTNPAAGDYHLNDYSPCIGAGTSEGAPAEDIEGKKRGTPPDMGAYENSRDVPLAVISPETTPLEVSGTVFKQDGVTLAPDGLSVTVTNTTRLLSITTETGMAGPGRYSATFTSFSGIVAAIGDKITVVVKSDGEDIGSATHILTDREVQAQKVTIDVSTHAAMDTYTIRADAGSGGSIDPSGVLVVNKGTDKTFTIMPDDGYYVADVLVDGASVGAVTSYTFTNVTADHTIEATFSISTPQITVSPSPIAFGNVLVGEATTVTVSIGNIGKTDLNVTDITSDLGAILTISETTFTVAPDATHEITLRFRYTFGTQPGALTAATDGEIHGTLTITSNDPDSPTEIAISANVLPAQITQVSPATGGLGTEITVEGVNFGANEPVNIGFGTEETIAQVTTEADGSFSAIFAITAPKPEGNVTIKATGVTSGQEVADSSFVYLGPSIESLAVDKAEVRNGETFVISVVSESGLTVVADVSKVDNTKTTVTLPEEVDGTYTTSVTVSEENTAEDGVKTITVTATDAVGNSVTGTATIELISDIDAVKPLSTFKLNLAPGLNIISVPLANANASVNDRAPIEVKFVGDLKMLLGEDTSFYHDDTPAGKLSEAPVNMPIEGDIGFVVRLLEGITVEFRGEAWPGEINLAPGLNIFAMPLDPYGIETIGDLRTQTALSFHQNAPIYYCDTSVEKFKRAEGTMPIEGGVGYITLLRNPITISLEGTAWRSETLPLSPISIPNQLDLTSTSLIELSGTVVSEKTIMPLNGLSVTVRHIPSGIVMTDTTGSTKSSAGASPSLAGKFSTVFLDIFNNRVVKIGDVFEIDIYGKNNLRVEPIRHTVTAEDVRSGRIALGNLVARVIPKYSKLLQNYPNPFNPETWIPFQLAQDASVTISIYNAKGQFVRTISLGNKNASVYMTKDRAAYWDGRDGLGEKVSSGVYFYTLEAGKFKVTRKMMIIK